MTLKNKDGILYSMLEQINTRPMPFEFYTASELWADEYTSKQMLACHLNENLDLSSRKMSFIYESADWIIQKFTVRGGTCLADFGCGPGLYTSRLVKTGAEVTGIDFSSRSIEYAREQAKLLNLSIDYIQLNYLEFETDKKFDLILMIYCDFCALSPAQRKILLDKFHSLLKPGGRVLLDVCSEVGFKQFKESASYEFNQLNGFWQEEPYYGFQNSFKYEAEKVSLDKYTIIGSNTNKTVYNWLQYFSVASLCEEFRAANLTVTEVLADVTGLPFNPEGSEFAVIAELL